MADYVGIDGAGLAVSGMWSSDSIAPTGQTLQLLTGSADMGWTWDGTDWAEPLLGINELRADRDGRLSSCDWITNRHRDQLDDGITTAITTTKYDEWIDYRQDLREITDGYTPIVSSAVVWPTEPL